MLIDLETIKNHLNIDSSFNDDDNYIMQLEEVAEAIVEKHIDRTLEEELHASVVDRLLGIIDNTLEHEVSLLKLVVEEEIVVRELNLQRIAMSLGKV